MIAVTPPQSAISSQFVQRNWQTVTSSGAKRHLTFVQKKWTGEMATPGG